MADTYTYQPNYNRNNRLGTYLNQYGATSGRVPSARILDDIIQGELDAASNNMYRNKALQLQKEAAAENARQFNVGQENAVDTAEANRNAGLINTGVQTLGTYGLYKALKPATTTTGTGTQNLVGEPPVSTIGNMYDSATTWTGNQFHGPVQWDTPMPTGENFYGPTMSATETAPTIAGETTLGSTTIPVSTGTGVAGTTAGTAGATGYGAGETASWGLAGEGAATGATTGATAASTFAATVPIVGALVAGGLLIKELGAKYKDEGGVMGYLGKSSQHPVAAVVDPITTLFDLGITDSSSPIARGEEWIVDKIFGGCIIVTACTDRHSPEVEIAREYRDKYLTPEQRRGYYMIAEKVVPALRKYPCIKRLTKRFLVDNLISYGRYALKKGPEPGTISRAVTKAFLWLCKQAGQCRLSFTRANGETV